MRLPPLLAVTILNLLACAPSIVQAQFAVGRPKPIDADPPESLESNTETDAGDRYEIEVYPAATVAPGRTVFELHSNYTLTGFTATDDGTIPDNHALHETLEITHGFTDWSELGAYAFTSQNPGDGWGYVGSSIRPRVRVPESWGWPIGLSLSQEISRVEPRYSVDIWSYELRPILDRQIERWYVSINPTFEHSLRGPEAAKGFQFTPSADVGYDVTAQVNLALEYYGEIGTATRVLPSALQQNQLFYVVNLNLSPAYEINVGYGTGLDRAAEKRMIKLILGRKI